MTDATEHKAPVITEADARLTLYAIDRAISNKTVRQFDIRPQFRNKIAYVSSVYDGDTITLVGVLEAPELSDPSAKLYPVYSIKARLYGVDTPEIKPTVGSKEEKELEKKAGIHVRDKLRELILNKHVICTTVNERDKWGRLLCFIVTADGLNINEWLIQNRYTYKYDGGTKKAFDTNTFNWG